MGKGEKGRGKGKGGRPRRRRAENSAENKGASVRGLPLRDRLIVMFLMFGVSARCLLGLPHIWSSSPLVPCPPQTSPETETALVMTSYS